MEKAGFSDDAFAGVPVFQVLCLRTADFKWFICTLLSSRTYLLIHSVRNLQDILENCKKINRCSYDRSIIPVNN